MASIIAFVELLLKDSEKQYQSWVEMSSKEVPSFIGKPRVEIQGVDEGEDLSATEAHPS